MSWADRAILAGLTQRLCTAHRRQLSLIVTPRTLLRWHADLVRRRWTYPRRTPGPDFGHELDLILIAGR